MPIIHDAPDSLIGVVWITMGEGGEFHLTHAAVPDAVPIPRRNLAVAFRRLADAIDEVADHVGD